MPFKGPTFRHNKPLLSVLFRRFTANTDIIYEIELSLTYLKYKKLNGKDLMLNNNNILGKLCGRANTYK